ncbi:hypothetical protein [Actinokineospora sp.]|uniref:hypothetical protein n=1 Tax=Actinokineospora sp. TaxID=1872133 RepID=UPI0040380C77
MTKLMSRLREPLSTTDKRIATGVGLLFATAYGLVNYGTIRSATRGCVEAGHAAPVGPATGATQVIGSDSVVMAATARLCPNPFTGPDTTDLLMSLGATLPSIAFGAITLILLGWFLWGAVRPGLHSPVTPGRLRTLGWFVLIAGPIAEAVQYVFVYELAEKLIENTAEYRAGLAESDFNGAFSAWSQELQMNFPWWCVFAGATALLVSRLLKIEVRMGEELEGTI